LVIPIQELAMVIRPGPVIFFLSLSSGLAVAQSKPPVAQFWADVATSNMSMPGMEGMGDMAGMMMGGGHFGGTKSSGGSPGKWLDTALFTRNKPSGTEGSHAIPPSMSMGPMLPLLPVQAARAERGESYDGDVEKPKGRLLFYWGCGEAVRQGQPRIVDFSKLGSADFGTFMAGRFAPDRGAKAVPGRSVWPNERDRKRVPNEASLQGDHAVTGEGVPAGLRFALGAAYDFMPKVQMTARGEPQASVNVGWQPVAHARGYFLSAMGVKGETDMIMWSSSEQPDPGWGLMDYLTPSRVDKLIEEKVVLPAGATNCAIPQGIYAGAEGAMVRMIAYGPELNLVHPPRPADPKASWDPEWAARVRVKSTGMTILGMGGDEDAPRRGRKDRGMREESAQDKEESGQMPTPGNVLRGIFGR
jgi:hypothetical protein